MTGNAKSDTKWAARYAHTSVIDAAGNIYVLGGGDAAGYYRDVWRSADQGAAPHRCALPASPPVRVRACVRALRARTHAHSLA
jgi:hypothetical protein